MCANQVNDGKRIVIMGTKTNRKGLRYKIVQFLSIILTIEFSNIHPLFR